MHKSQNRKYTSLNLPIREDKLRVENRVFTFSSVCSASLSKLRPKIFGPRSKPSHGNSNAAIFATALLFQVHCINIFLIKIHTYESINLIIEVFGFIPVWMKSTLILIFAQGFDVFW